MARCNKSFYALLLFIAKEPRSGYDIKAILERTSKWYWVESNSQIYPMLKKLADKGYVSSTLDQTSGARARKVYTITEQGLARLKEWLEQPVEYSTYREELLLKLNAGQFMTGEQLLIHLRAYLVYINSHVHDLDDVIEHINRRHKDRPDYDYLMMTYDYAQDLWQAKKKWCQKTIKKVKNKRIGEVI